MNPAYQKLCTFLWSSTSLNMSCDTRHVVPYFVMRCCFVDLREHHLNIKVHVDGLDV